ncbi:MAG TPA: hypothetical protein VMT46_08560 [Anaerolineaceae bacterium]|nr:hypothetical protein [Anaerolineaceae bacterium]
MKYGGTWQIVEMEMWDETYFNMEVQAFIRVEPNGMGEFQFGLVSGALDGEVVETGKEERFEFTWDGQDENDPAFGSGWLQLSGKDKLQGSIKFHLGDRSAFQAVRAEDPDNAEAG